MLIGPIFSRELAIAPRRPAHYIYRTAYPLVLLVLMWTAWLVMVGLSFFFSYLTGIH